MRLKVEGGYHQTAATQGLAAAAHRTTRISRPRTRFTNTRSNTRRNARLASSNPRRDPHERFIVRPDGVQLSSVIFVLIDAPAAVNTAVGSGGCLGALAAAPRPPSTPERMDRASLERDVNEYIERTVTRADELAPARAALVAATDARTAGNDSFRSGDFATAMEWYEKGERARCGLDALREPVTMAAAERALLALLANSAQCALKLGEHARAAKLATAALGIHVCASEPALFKKVMVRLALAKDASGDADAAVATCEEAQLRGLSASDFDAIMRKAGRTSVGTLGDGHEPRMFVMLGLRLSDGAENLARIRGVVESGSLPHVDRRDEAGNNILWGTLHALHGAVEPSANGGKGEAGTQPAARAQHLARDASRRWRTCTPRSRPVPALRRRQDPVDVRRGKRARHRGARDAGRHAGEAPGDQRRGAPRRGRHL